MTDRTGGSAQLRLGGVTTDITPAHPLVMAGFGQRRPFDEVARRIKARVLVFERENVRAILVSADLLRWSPRQVESLRGRLLQATGVPPELVLLHATHTHCAPQTSLNLEPLQPAADPGYLAELEERIVAAARRAAADTVPVEASLGHGHCGFAVNRRLWRDGKVAMAPNPNGPIDPQVTVASFRREDGTPVALLVHYTCHPTTSAQNCISPDFAGTAMDFVEADLGPGTVAAYLQGCCGDIRPALVEDGRFYRGSQADVERLARECAAAVHAARSDTQVALGDVPLRGHRQRAELPYAHLPTLDELQVRAELPEAEGRLARRLIANSDWRCGHAELEASLLQLAGGLSLLALNAEPVVEYGFAIRRIGGPGVLPLGYSNGMLGYLPTARQLEEGGYEADQSTRAYGLPGPLGPDTESLALKAITDCLAMR